MLTELQAQAGEGNIINVGVVNFEQGVLKQLKLTTLNDENYNDIRDAMTYQNPHEQRHQHLRWSGCG